MASPGGAENGCRRRHGASTVRRVVLLHLGLCQGVHENAHHVLRAPVAPPVGFISIRWSRATSSRTACGAVRITPDALARGVAFLDASGVDLASGFPRQLTSCAADRLLLPLIHFVLLGFLPIARSRMDNSPGLAAGCGQLFITRRGDYLRAGGHTAIRAPGSRRGAGNCSSPGAGPTRGVAAMVPSGAHSTMG